VKIRVNADAELTLSQLEKLANNLIDKRHELSDILDVLNRKIVTKTDCSIKDAAEAASLQEEIARASGIAGQYNETITEIDHVLKKLENGYYGLSEKSGEPIAYERLSLIPWARSRSNE